MTGGLSQPSMLRQQSDITASHPSLQPQGSHHSIHRYHPTQPHTHNSSSTSSSYHLQGSGPPHLLQSLNTASDPPSASSSLPSPHRPTSAPPDLELNSTSVFAFGLYATSLTSTTLRSLRLQ